MGSTRTSVFTVVDLQKEEVAWELNLGKGVRPMTIETNPDGSTKAGLCPAFRASTWLHRHRDCGTRQAGGVLRRGAGHCRAAPKSSAIAWVCPRGYSASARSRPDNKYARRGHQHHRQCGVCLQSRGLDGQRLCEAAGDQYRRTQADVVGPELGDVHARRLAAGSTSPSAGDRIRYRKCDRHAETVKVYWRIRPGGAGAQAHRNVLVANWLGFRFSLPRLFFVAEFSAVVPAQAGIMPAWPHHEKR